MLPAMIELLAISILAGPPGWGGDVDKALEAGKPLVVYVHADWCTPCNQLGNEVLETEDLAVVVRGATGVSADFDTDAGRKVVERFGVINLPTVLYVGKDGGEIGRVEGYPGREEFLRAFADVRAGKQSLEELEKQLKEAPGDLDLLVSVAQAKLVRGQQSDAKALLDRAMEKGGAIGARAVRTWGRWLIRVKGDAAPATTFFLTWMKNYEGKPEADHFRYWAAVGLWRQGKKGEALKLMDARIAADPRGAKAARSKASFMVLHGYDPRECEIAVRAALSLDDDSGWSWYLLAESLLRQGRNKEATAAIGKARKREPKKAIFANFAVRRLGLPR